MAETRSIIVKKTLIDVTYQENEEIICGAKLPSGMSIVCVMLFLCNQNKRKGQKQMTAEKASQVVAEKVRSEWIKKNVYPAHENTVARKIQIIYQTFREYSKQHDSVNHKKTTGWCEKVKSFNTSMTKNAYDFRTSNREYQTQLEKIYNVKMTKEDEEFYNDNCHGAYIGTCSSSVPRSWMKQKKRKEKREISLENKHQKDDMVSSHTTDIRSSNSESSDTEENLSGEFHSNLPVDAASSNAGARSPVKTRQTDEVCNSNKGLPPAFPEIKVRTSRKLINEKVIRCATQCLADYKVSLRDLSGIIVHVANIVFDQKWKLQDEVNEEGDGEMSDEEDISEDNPDVTKPKRRKVNRNLENVFPSRRSLNRYLQDASYLNLRMVAEIMLSKNDNVVTVGIDDTVKAAGRRLYDVKTDHITVSGPNQARRILTTGYSENISHTGLDAAQAYTVRLKILAALADSSVEDIKESIDFWMCDRAGDCAVMLDNLDIDEQKILNRNAHVILGVDNAADKVFRQIEQSIGIQKLIDVKAGEKVFLSPSSSIHTLALIAIAKLLSPSHAAHSISLYSDYKTWIESEGQKEGFKGFTANRFGRIADIAREFLRNRDIILKFFDSVVDENANKLVLAVSIYIQNSWFLYCVRIYERLGNDIIFPLMELLGIDNNKQKKCKNRTWQGIREFYDEKIPTLKATRDKLHADESGENRLYSAVLTEVIETLERQLSTVPFFKQSCSGVELDEEKLKNAPITNLGAESAFASLDNRIAVSGGSASITLHSRKTIISTNCFLVNTDFNSKATEEERRKSWKWARTSNQVEDAKEIESNFLATVQATKKLSLYKKQELKKKRVENTLKTLEKCKLHNGPITVNSIEEVEKLNEKELLTEIKYLRATIAPNIRQKRRITVDGKYKMEKFPVQELRQSIKNVVKPESDVTLDVEKILKEVL